MGGPAFMPSPFVPTEEGCLVKDMFSDQCLEYEKKAAAYDAAAVASARAQSSVKSLPPIREKLVKLQALVEANKLGQANNEVSNVAGVLVPLVASVDSTKGKNVKTKMFDLATACVKKDQAAAIASIRAVIELVDSL
ncbi:hypothetical protein TL16_g06747 [Triparma laevis f. inornata]|uniref:Uncharacterized protein n=2 Tax=Triparma laevis TaxID=1534972 RepID=A0A9W7CGR1_9STRA|nr:hypothetical protein TL16_g06747 [Triparma laevis f. inornata]GMI05796.1 hypothetical protein TrLO_g346 [Triparma laevis f. longispina]